jgi:hypothetical protein
MARLLRAFGVGKRTTRGEREWHDSQPPRTPPAEEPTPEVGRRSDGSDHAVVAPSSRDEEAVGGPNAGAGSSSDRRRPDATAGEAFSIGASDATNIAKAMDEPSRAQHTADLSPANDLQDVSDPLGPGRALPFGSREDVDGLGLQAQVDQRPLAEDRTVRMPGMAPELGAVRPLAPGSSLMDQDHGRASGVDKDSRESEVGSGDPGGAPASGVHSGWGPSGGEPDGPPSREVGSGAGPASWIDPGRPSAEVCTGGGVVDRAGRIEGSGGTLSSDAWVPGVGSNPSVGTRSLKGSPWCLNGWRRRRRPHKRRERQATGRPVPSSSQEDRSPSSRHPASTVTNQRPPSLRLRARRPRLGQLTRQPEVHGRDRIVDRIAACRTNCGWRLRIRRQGPLLSRPKVHGPTRTARRAPTRTTE